MKNGYSKMETTWAKALSQVKKAIKSKHGIVNSIDEVTMSGVARLQRVKHESMHQMELLTFDGLLRGQFNIFYITNEHLIDLFVSTKISGDNLMSVEQIIKEKCDRFEVPNFFAAPNKSRYQGIIHSKGLSISVIFSMLYDSIGEVTLFVASNKNDIAHIRLDGKELKKTLNVVNSGELKKEILTVLGFFLYSDAFPECLIDGPPPIIKQGTEIKAKHRIVTISKEIEEIYKHGVTPHLRRGHFRTLKAERYKAKRYQTIYVKPTIVNGHSKHLVEHV